MRKQSPHFRKEEVQYVMRCWQASQSCSLIGIGSVGKSNLLQHLSDPDIHAMHLGSTASQMKSIIIDPNLLVPIDEGDSTAFRSWAGYELMMHRLYLAFYPFEMLGEDAEAFFATYQELQDGTNPLYVYMGLRYFELGLQFFLRRGIKIVFMFDEFEELARKLPAKFFQTLRGLRDNHKTSLFYLTFSREPLQQLMASFQLPVDETEPFVELFTDNNYFVGPYNMTDARAMAEQLLQRRPYAGLTEHTIDFVLYASGRFPGIMRACFHSLEWLGQLGPDAMDRLDLLDRLASRRSIMSECETIWGSLSTVEQTVLKALVQKQVKPDSENFEQGVTLLVQKRLLRVLQAEQQLFIEPPVLRAYIANTIIPS